MARSFHLAAGLICVLAVASPAPAGQCEGRCRDGRGNVAVVSAGECDAITERCRAGCDRASSPVPHPYAVCVSQSTGLVAPRAQIVQPGGKRTRVAADEGKP